MYKRIAIVLIIMAVSLFFILTKVMIAEEAIEQEKQETGKVLTINDFIELATQKDTEFEKILIDEFSLQYEKDLGLPARDIVLSVKGQYDFILNQEREDTDASVSLSKLFPFTGTSLTAEYAAAPSYTSTVISSDFNFEVSQPIAENAFGKATRLKDKIIGVEIDIAMHQIIEAYEDYLATIIVRYYDWYEAYENFKIGESSYQENLKLLQNIKDRQKNKIALSIDVNKISLQVLAKKEKLIELRGEYTDALNFIKAAIRYEGDEEIMPEEPSLYDEVMISFNDDFEAFKKKSRTYEVLNLLEEKSSLEVDEDADDLLPSIDLLLGYNVKGKDWGIKNEDSMAYVGISMDWPFPDQIEKAEYEAAKIALEKTKLSTVSIHFKLYTDIKNLSIEMGSEKELLNITKEKIGFARSVLEAETENYSFGKITLNDYIAAVNVLDNNRFNEILHNAQHYKLLIEWLRITDQLISKKDIQRPRK